MKRLTSTLEKLNIDRPEEKAETLMAYMDGILKANENVNLTAITDREEFIDKHIIDSLLAISSSEVKDAKKIIDMGTGGGFPGVPLAVAFPDKEFLLVDSLNKRIKIIEELCERIGIKNVRAVHGRAEEMARKPEYREGFDLCVSRAVANMNTLSEYCLPFVKIGGSLIAYKGPDCESEIKEAIKAIEILGGKLDRIEKAGIELTDFDGKLDYEHELVYVHKVDETPKAYPRKAGTPAKKPLMR